jgi:hypothetical protein
MRVTQIFVAFTLTLLLQVVAHAEPPLSEKCAHARAVVLVRVIDSTFPPPPESGHSDALGPTYYTATLEVRRTWKGPLSPGARISVSTMRVCPGTCFWYPFRVGEDVIVFANQGDLTSLGLLDEAVDSSKIKEVTAVFDALGNEPGT